MVEIEVWTVGDQVAQSAVEQVFPREGDGIQARGGLPHDVRGESDVGEVISTDLYFDHNAIVVSRGPFGNFRR